MTTDLREYMRKRLGADWGRYQDLCHMYNDPTNVVRHAYWTWWLNPIDCAIWLKGLAAIMSLMNGTAFKENNG